MESLMPNRFNFVTHIIAIGLLSSNVIRWGWQNEVKNQKDLTYFEMPFTSACLALNRKYCS